jgi:glycosyltransferase involved in cell wall biosynthesis
MFKLYGLQAKRLENLRHYDAIVTHSDHMLSELIKHGLSPKSAYNFPYYVPFAHANAEQHQVSPVLAEISSQTPEMKGAHGEPFKADAAPELNLLFSGRMEYLKGGHIFLEALPMVSAALAKPLYVTFAGDGRERAALERRAEHIGSSQLKIEFVGWVERRRIESLLENCDLLVVPSLWPEPFGLVGPEAGHFGVPVAAFDVGGIPDWLLDGVNGYLAPGSPPTAEGLAEAIINCVRDPGVHARLRAGAIEVAQQFNIKNHLTALLEVFSSVIARQ